MIGSCSSIGRHHSKTISPSRVRVKSAVLTARHSLPVCPDKQTCSEPCGMSQTCHLRTSMGAAVVASARDATRSWPRTYCAQPQDQSVTLTYHIQLAGGPI